MEEKYTHDKLSIIKPGGKFRIWRFTIKLEDTEDKLHLKIGVDFSNYL